MELATVVPLFKVCAKCKQEKPYGDFTNLKRSRDGKEYACRQCHKERNQLYNKNPERVKIRFGYKLKNRYGLTPEQFAAMSAKQNDKCAICNQLSPDGKRLHVDHDHTTGAVRQLLCVSCNHGLGLFYEKPELLAAAIQYILKHK